MPTTTTTHAVAVVVRLSCNHTLARAKGDDFPMSPERSKVGATLECPKCPAKKAGGQPVRRIKTVETTNVETTVEVTDEQQALIDSALTPVPDPTPEAIVAVQAVIDEAAGYDVWKARDEHRAMAEWVRGGKVGPMPTTANLDAMNAAHAAGKPRSGSRGTKATARPRNTDPVRLAANEARKAKGPGGRTNLHRVNDAELLAYVTAARAAHPGTRSVDLRDYALWVDEVSVSFKRWDAAWDATNQ